MGLELANHASESETIKSMRLQKLMREITGGSNTISPKKKEKDKRFDCIRVAADINTNYDNNKLEHLFSLSALLLIYCTDRDVEK